MFPDMFWDFTIVFTIDLQACHKILNIWKFTTLNEKRKVEYCPLLEIFL